MLMAASGSVRGSRLLIKNLEPQTDCRVSDTRAQLTTGVSGSPPGVGQVTRRVTIEEESVRAKSRTNPAECFGNTVSTCLFCYVTAVVSDHFFDLIHTVDRT